MANTLAYYDMKLMAGHKGFKVLAANYQKFNEYDNTKVLKIGTCEIFKNALVDFLRKY